MDGEFQRCFRLVVVALSGMQHRKVVVWLGQFRVILGHASEDLNGIGYFFLLGEDQPLQKATLRIFGLLLQTGIHFQQCLLKFSLLIQTTALLEIGGGIGAGQTGHAECNACGGKQTADSGAHRAICAGVRA